MTLTLQGEEGMPRPTVLIVDDEVFFRRLFSDILKEGDKYDIEEVSSGKEALERLAKGKPIDVILADLVMPEVCGLELIRRTRSFDPAPDIILATGNATVESAIQALKSGARDYLIKPCNPEQLRHTIKTCVEQRRLIAENSQLLSQIRLYQKGQHLSGQLDVAALFQESINTLRNEIGPSRGLAFFVNQNGISQISSSDELTVDQARALAEYLVVRTKSQQKTELLRVQDLPGCGDCCDDLRTLWVFPMNSENQEHGALVLCNQAGSDLPEHLPLDSLTFLAEQVAIGFGNACQYHGARELIYTDDLTGLYNHRYLHIAIEQEIRRSERYGLEFSVAFIDIDYFKNINDQHGHLIGSDILKQVAEKLRECVRDADMLFRYGGDEFTALLVETDTRGAKIVAERIRRTIADFTFRLGAEQTCRLTGTVGHATYPIHAATKNELVDLADKAMYFGKNDRNIARSASELRSP